MSITHTDFVIQISTSQLANAPDTETTNEEPLVSELRRTLRPGVEIALVFRGYLATTSILWLEGPFVDHSMRACVRLLGVSVLPAGYAGSSIPSDEAPPRDTPFGWMESPLCPSRS